MKTNTIATLLAALAWPGALLVGALETDAATQQTNGPLFIYQGQLIHNGVPANGLYDMQFALYAEMTNTLPLGQVVSNLNVAVSNGLFMVDLPVNQLGPQPEPPDSPALIEDAPVWLEIWVRPGGSQEPLSLIGPRQKVTHAPRAAYAGMARTVLDGAITDSKLGTNSVGPLALRDGAVEERHLADGAVSRPKLPDGVIDTSALGEMSVTTAKLAMDAVAMGNIMDYSVTGPKIADGSVVRSVNGIQEHLVLSASSGIDLNVTSNRLTFSAVRNCADYANCYWSLLGNVGTVAGTHFVGTLDNQPLEIKVNRLRAARFEDNGDGDDPGTTPEGAPNVIMGSPVNFVAPGVVGATISGGGATNHWGQPQPNSVLAEFGSIGGGVWHLIEPVANYATIAGGYENRIGTNASSATIAGGIWNWIIGILQQAEADRNPSSCRRI